MAADVCRHIVAVDTDLVVQTVRSDRWPRWVDADTLVVAVSYSGNTDEVLRLFDEALAHRAHVFTVTAGGRLASRALEVGMPVVRVPRGYAPRTAFVCLIFTILGLMERLSVYAVPTETFDECFRLLQVRSVQYGRRTPTSDNYAKKLAYALANRPAIIYGIGDLGGLAAYRWKCQMNENAKTPAFANAFPEVGHNEIESWRQVSIHMSRAVAVMLHDEPPLSGRQRLGQRAVDLARRHGLTLYEALPQARSPLARLLDLTCLGDFTSVYTAFLTDTDPSILQAVNEWRRDNADDNQSEATQEK
jgi:glucose/mannose-6-phosphate isomerase